MEEEKAVFTPEEIEEIIRQLEKEYPELVQHKPTDTTENGQQSD